MNYGFLIRNDRCIGCHACSTACKSENNVPLGVYRTWVKSVEVGVYPNVRRHFQVTRCNHCANPPCVRICPVTAMYQRDDGIVEFDPDVCIGCKACLQACPYDAIYVDPETGTAAKCHFCAHRIELGLEPACVVVCPEHAIIAGDLDDPNSEISRMLAELEVTVRKPEQGTAPKLFYVEGNDANLTPTAVEAAPPTFAWADAWSDRAWEVGGDGAPERARADRTADSGTPIRTPGAQGIPEPGPIFIGEGRMAGQMTQVAYNVQHRIPWHWPVPAYLVTKGISAGLFLLMALGVLLGGVPPVAPTLLWAGLGTLLFLGITTGLLVYDLERPERFLRIVFRPQWKSWLARGAFLLIGFGAVAGLWWVLEGGAWLGWWAEPAAMRPFLLGVGVPLALGAAVYTAFLFAQAEGRDLWQSPLLPVHLLVQAALAGSALILLTAPWLPWEARLLELARWTLGLSLGLDLLVTLLGEFGMPHASEVAARAAHRITHGPYRHHFWTGSLLLGHLVPLALLAFGGLWGEAAAGLLALVGLYLYEYAFVMAPQEIPNS
ncbi:4Fe-4S dicluster domain-containing protein [Rhodothermus profundi]|uniref:Fe-S-cluster-containing dehydrogenase component n=1 Tax=Rhodothermus profundi TaxID=633813 RepID=A0A1M6RLK7_9BACT|nr:4Fe-4S dicluster domain-containing protein [Rhodothermus profundi]SHK33381.1 Fe-S-cluster-containing dehydrogenase component [Rhodothermus profundi]